MYADGRAIRTASRLGYRVIMGWLQRRYLDVDIPEPLAARMPKTVRSIGEPGPKLDKEPSGGTLIYRNVLRKVIVSIQIAR